MDIFKDGFLFVEQNWLPIIWNAAVLLICILAVFIVNGHGLTDHSSPINSNSTFTASEEGFIKNAFAQHDRDIQNLSEFLQIKIIETGQEHKAFIEWNEANGNSYWYTSDWLPNGSLRPEALGGLPL